MPEVRVIQPGEGFRVMVAPLPGVAGQSNGATGDGASAFFEFLSIVADPAKAKAAAEKLALAQSEATAAAAQFRDLKSRDAALKKEKFAFETWVTAERGRLQEATHSLEAQREQLEIEKRQHLAAAEALAAEKVQFEQIKRAHELQLAELIRFRKLLSAA